MIHKDFDVPPHRFGDSRYGVDFTLAAAHGCVAPKNCAPALRSPASFGHQPELSWLGRSPLDRSSPGSAFRPRMHFLVYPLNLFGFTLVIGLLLPWASYSAPCGPAIAVQIAPGDLFRVVAPCTAPPLTHTPPRPTALSRMMGETRS